MHGLKLNHVSKSGYKASIHSQDTVLWLYDPYYEL